MLLMSMMMLLAADASAPQTPDVLLDGLAGSCWRTDLPGNTTDTHCFTLSTGGKLGLDVHKVRDGSGAVVYEGVTAYRPDTSGKVDLGYSNSLGDLMPGTASRAGDTLSFTLTLPDGTPAAITWQIGTDGYNVTSPMGSQHFSKTGAAPEGGL